MTAKAVQPAWRLGAILAAATVALDQLSKYYVVEILRLGEARFAEGQGPIAIAPFLDLSFVPNPGISYGLFPQNSEVGRWILIGLTLAAVIFIAVWILRTRSLLTSAALGLIAGGAIGNGLDRAHYGAVVDFLHLHGGAQFQWRIVSELHIFRYRNLSWCALKQIALQKKIRLSWKDLTGKRKKFKNLNGREIGLRRISMSLAIFN